MKKGKFIVFEGISGTGKETQAKLLQNYLTTEKIKTEIVYHPSPELKEILSKWRRTRDIDRITEVYLLLADRYDHVSRIIKPSIKEGKWVVSLRNWVSALVYQGRNEEERNWIRTMFARFEPAPDRVFLFDIDPETAFERITNRHRTTGEKFGRFETQKLLFEKRKAYLDVMGNINYIRIDAGLKSEVIHSQIRKSLIRQLL